MSIDATIIASVILFIAALLFTLVIRSRVSLFSSIFAYTAILFIAASLFLFLYSRENIVGALRYYLDIKNAEFNHYATFSSTLLFTACITSIVIALFTQPRHWWHIGLWLYLASLFLFLSLDEYFQLHERWYGWKIYYISVATFSSFLLGIFVWWAYPRKQLLAYVTIIGGMGLAATGGLGLEKFVAKACFDLIEPYNNCVTLPLLEEILEALGYATAAVGMLLFAEQSFPSKQWHTLKRIVASGILVWAFICIFSYWIQPTFEKRFFATPVYANFADSQMLLQGYRINRQSVTAGESFTVDLYWHTGQVPSRQYGYTINLVHPATGESIYLENTKIIDPTTDGWFAGTTHRTSLTMTLPDDITTPVSAYLIVTLWREQGEGSLVINPEATDREQFGAGSPIIAHLPILSPASNAPDAAEYQFANGARLLDYTIAQDEDNLTLTFNWSTTQAIDTTLSQMLHLVHENGEDRLIFDQPPFAGAFPTTAWVTGMNEVVTWHITLPREAVVSGTYTVYTGLYDVNGLRVNVTQSDGMPVPENAIPLGEITLESER
jgi:hypothetical protein